MESEIRALEKEAGNKNMASLMNGQLAKFRANPIARELNMLDSWIWLRKK
jgi:hypothetical protein